MSTVHLVFLVLTFTLPLLFCGVSRWLPSVAFDRSVCRGLALVLLATEVGELVFKIFVEKVPLGSSLPMHLCDWALLATAAALWWQAPRCFEVAYFWGLAGTIQGLFTLAIDHQLALWRHVAFFLIHSGIVVGVLFLVFARGMRPVSASLGRVLMWSEVYLFTALLVNWLTGENYGFLSHPPSTPSPLDHFPKTPWLYVATINGFALGAFALLYVPWWIADRRKKSPLSSTRG